MEENNKLIPISNNSLVKKATISLAITNKLVAENNKQMVVEIFRKNPKLFLDLISNYYTLDTNTLLEFKDILNWQLLSTNENLEWYLGTENPFEKDLNWSTISDYEYIRGLATRKETYYLFDVIKGKWNWHELSKNKSLPWSENLIEEFKDKWDWERLSENESLPWSENLIENFIDRWNWLELSGNKNLPWSIEFIEKHYDKVEWYYISQYQKLSESFIEKYSDKVNWGNISTYQTLSEDFTEKYRNKLK